MTWVTARIKVYTRLHLIAVAVAVLFITLSFVSQPASGLNYSQAKYGQCTYGSCGITLSTSGSIAINVTPTGGSTTCTVSNGLVTVTTTSSTGYTASLTDSDTSTTLDGPVTVTASSGTPASPATLAANTWGYRIDGVAGFGSGPTSAITNGSIPGAAFSGVPSSTDTPGLVRYTSTVDGSPVATSVWYGVCADSTLQSGSYSDSITYTAVVN